MPTTDVQPRTCAACGETFYISTEIPEEHEVAQFCPECSQIINNENILPMMIGGVPLIDMEEEDLTRDEEGEKEDDEFGDREQEEEDLYKEEHDAFLVDPDDEDEDENNESYDTDDEDEDDEDDL